SNLHSVTSKPLGLTTPLSVAVVEASELAGSVLTVGLTGVVVVLKVASGLSEVRPALVATIRKWYSVPSVRPVSAAETATFEVPEPGAGVHVALSLHAALPIYSNLHSVTSKPLGLTTPLSVAVVEASELAGSVLTVGG